MNQRPAILEHAALLSEPTRCRLLHVLEGQELTVTELCSVLQLPQSTTSRHLKVLADGGWIAARKDGTSNLYHPADSLGGAARELWTLVRSEVAESPECRQDRRRLEAVLRERRSRSKEFFSATAEEWDQLRDELFGPRFDLEALLALLDPSWTVGDLGCGTGRTSEALAPFVARVYAVDGSAAMLEAARGRLENHPNVALREGELERLPLPDRCLDAATLFLALHHVPDPAEVLRETHRVLRPGGRLIVADMLPHGRDEYRREMGHVWLGFSEEQVARLLSEAGFEAIRLSALGPDPGAKGPALFVAGASAEPEPISRRTRSENATVPTLEEIPA
ncbi:MAG: metalloregulator ArsR/SmtB family transcription factor [Holophagales bacterium]|nr:metalloregulator ArsR/SmtB family transcription factor [Holophagales bacterium]